MDVSTKKYRSLFDIMEDQSAQPCLFHWTPCTYVKPLPEEFLFEGELLFISRRGGLLKQRRCILYRSFLVRHRVTKIG